MYDSSPHSLSTSKKRKIHERDDEEGYQNSVSSSNVQESCPATTNGLVSPPPPVCDEPQHRQNFARPKPHHDLQEYYRNVDIWHLRNEGLWQDILLMYEQEWETFTNKNYECALTALSRIRTLDKNHPKFRSFVNDLVSRVENEGYEWLGNLQMGRVLQQIARMHLRTPSINRLLDVIQEEKCSKWLVDEAQTQTIANIAWALSRLDCHADIFFKELDQQADWFVSEGNAQDIATVVYACGVLRIKYCKNLFHMTDKNAQYICEKGPPIAICRILSTCSRLKLRLPNFFRHFDRNAVRLKRGQPEDMAKCAMASGSLGKRFPNLFAEIEENAYWITNQGSIQNVSSILWACAKLNMQSPKLFDSVNLLAENIVEHGTIKEIVQIAWACATLEHKATRLFFEMNKRASYLVGGANDQKSALNTCTLVWACATLGIQAPKIFEELEKNAQSFCRSGNSQDMANSIWACAMMGFNAPELFSEVAQRAEWLIETCKMQILLLVCYSFVIADLVKTHEETFHKMWNAVISNNPFSFDNEKLNQLAQVEAFARVDGIQLKKQPHALQSRVDLCKVITEDDDHGLHYQKEISILLSRIGFEHEEEVSPLVGSLKGGLLSIDLGCRRRKVAIECDGPTHYLIDAETGAVTYSENGTTMAKRRFLKRSGWTVVNLNYQDRIKAYEEGYDERWLLEELLDAGVEFETRIALRRAASD